MLFCKNKKATDDKILVYTGVERTKKVDRPTQDKVKDLINKLAGL